MCNGFVPSVTTLPPMVPFFSARDVAAAVPPEIGLRAVREAFVAHARGEWTMQPKLYVTNYPGRASGRCPRSGAATRC